MSKYRVASLFAGIGGICLGFKQAGAEIVYANEIDSYACTTYRQNFNGAPYLVEGDVYKQTLSGRTDIDIIAAGFPCQAFSIAGYRKGFADDRGVLYTQVDRMINECHPKAVFLENVKNLMTHDKGHTYQIIKNALMDSGYEVTQAVLNTMNYGNIPQNRERMPGFFPGRDQPFDLELPNGETIIAKVCQDQGKAIMSNPNKDLGKWLLRDVLHLSEGELVTMDMLDNLGVNAVMFTRKDKGKYSIDFTQLDDY